MKMPRAATIAGLLSIVILILRCEAMVSISCPKVIKEVLPCSSFLQQSSSKQPSKACCNGIKKLSGDAGNKKDRIAICQCLKQGLAKIGKYDPKRLAQLPKDCGLPFTLPPIDQKTDCSKSIYHLYD
ncbi:non-specific lipid-transfer protein 1-like [Gastrolobium bilobum]|uniref:non-specific lipid-transfer protein 1-like n=1 Tax=Gastrolobium bilobum TaxID=150636 RepID=UPI002AAFB56F|nr:non-specific lipid-transfer protein 1-like [Gastrolobium bilobum]